MYPAPSLRHLHSKTCVPGGTAAPILAHEPRCGPTICHIVSPSTSAPARGTSGRDCRNKWWLMDFARKAAWTRIAFWLVGSTLAYNVVEAVVSLWAGVKAESVALLGFGLDSVIECAAAGFMLWRLSVEEKGADEERVEAAERKVGKFIGGTFIALALYVLIQSGLALLHHEHPSESLIGIILASASLVIMPIMSWGKFRAAAQIESASLRAEAKETLACAYLSFTLLAGLLANAVAGWWWADPVAALLMVPWLVREGVKGIRGEE
jgi:divalent metal cation (Fe/Co/Zn/Cd) transporter